MKVAAYLAMAVAAGIQLQPQPQPQHYQLQHPALALASSKQQAAVVSVSFWSQSLGIRKRAMLWLPPSYQSQPERRFPVAYYLHGAFGDEGNWVNLGRLGATLDSLVATGMPEMIVVMPDGDDGWYTTWNFLGDWPGCRRNRPANAEPADSYCVPWPHYDDYIARDVVAFVDQRYRTMPDARHRGIAGLSMGGFGAVTLAFAYPDVFGAAASHSGVLAPALGTSRRPVPAGRFDLDAIAASYHPGLWAMARPVFGSDSMAWAARDPANLARRLVARDRDRLPAIMADCGTEDDFLYQNRAFRDALGRLGVPLEYREHPGGHSWDYWRRHAAESAAWLAHRLSVP